MRAAKHNDAVGACLGDCCVEQVDGFENDGETGIRRQGLQDPENGNRPPHEREVIWLASSPDFSTLVSTASEREFYLWDAHSGMQ